MKVKFIEKNCCFEFVILKFNYTQTFQNLQKMCYTNANEAVNALMKIKTNIILGFLIA